MKKLLLLIALVTLNFLNAQTELQSSVDQSWNGSSWDNNQAYNYEYDANNNLTTTTSYVWNNGAWEELYKETYTYNSNNRATLFIYQEYDSNTSIYNNIFRDTYTYDSNNNPISLLSESWNGGQWVNDYRFDVNYVGGNIDNLLEQYWNGSTWVNEGRGVVTNDSNNRIIQIVNESWNNNTWELSDRDVITRNTNGLVLTNALELWNGTSYVEDDRTDYTIDSNGNRLTETETYQGQSYITNYTYDNSQLISSFAHPFADKTGFDYLTRSFPFYNKILSTESADNTQRTLYDYNNAITLSVNSFEVENKFIIYPNPVETDLIIETTNAIKTIEIYNILGLRVKTTNSTKINVEHLSEGIYTIKAIDNKGNKSIKKFTKK